MTDISVSSGNDCFIVPNKPLDTFDKALSKVKTGLLNTSIKPLIKVETDSSYLWLSDISRKDRYWDAHLSNTEQVSKMYSECEEFYKRSVRMSNCSRLLEFNSTPDEEGEISLKLSSAHFCRCRHCPKCQWRRSLKWQSRFLKALPKIATDHPKARYLLLTLTVRNCEITQLRETLTRMNHAWNKLTKRSQFPAVGWVKCAEVTRNKQDGTAHPHFHVLLMVKPGYFGVNYVTQQRWRELWQDCLKVGYEPQVNIQAIKPLKGAVDLSNGSMDEGKIKAVLEVSKYSVKEADLIADSEWLYELTRQLDKFKAIALGGIFRDYLSEKDLEDPDDLTHIREDSSESTESSEDEVKFRASVSQKDERYVMLSS